MRLLIKRVLYSRASYNSENTVYKKLLTFKVLTFNFVFPMRRRRKNISLKSAIFKDIWKISGLLILAKLRMLAIVRLSALRVKIPITSLKSTLSCLRLSCLWEWRTILLLSQNKQKYCFLAPCFQKDSLSFTH